MSLYIGEDKIGKVIVGTQESGGGINTNDATLTSGAQMLSPYTSYSKGVKYTGSIPTRTDSNMTVSANTVTAAAGYYANATSKSIPTVELATPGISVSASGLITATETQSAGYVAAGTATSTQQLTTQAATTITPGDSAQTAVAAGKYTTGAVTVAAVDADGVTITSNGTYTPDSGTYYNSVVVNVPTSGGSPSLQNKSVAPSESAQTVSADSGYDGLGTVSVGAISSTYVGSGIDQNSSSDLTVSGATVTAPAGYYESAATKTIASGTEGTPTATKGTVSNNSVSVTPSVTNSAGYISGSTKTGTAVTVSASELVSGTKTISASGTTDVTNYASASVAAGSATTPATTITANPGISVNSSTGLITATASANQNVTPTVSAGYVESGTAGAITVSGSNTSQLTTKAAATYNTSTTDQTISAGQFITGAQTIKAVTVSGLSASNILSGVTVKVGDANDDDRIASVTGNVVIQHYYTGSSAPSASTGSDGDIYLQTGA